MTKLKVSNNKSLYHSDNKDYLNYMMNKQVIAVDNSAPSMVSTPNINLPFGALQYIRPEAIQVLTAPKTADMIATPSQNGKFGDEAVVIKIKELLGTTSEDDGSAGDGINASVNYSTETRGVYYYRADWRVNDKDEVKISSGINENYRADQVNAAMEALAITRNKVFFNGVKEKKNAFAVHGLLNDPKLEAYKAVKSNGAADPKTFWTDKTPEQMYNDIVDALTALNDKSQGLVEDGGKLILATSPTAISCLNRTNQYGLNAMKLLKDTYGDRIQIVSCPQMTNADSNSDVFYLIYEGVMPTVINSYVEMARAYPVFVQSSETSQKISAAISGCIVQYPVFIVRYNGIIDRN